MRLYRAEHPRRANRSPSLSVERDIFALAHDVARRACVVPRATVPSQRVDRAPPSSRAAAQLGVSAASARLGASPRLNVMRTSSHLGLPCWVPGRGLTRTIDWYNICPVKMRRRARQLDLVIRSWGGRRAGAGRRPTPGRRPGVPHRRRAVHDVRCPAHATLPASVGIPSMRGGRVFVAVRGALAASSDVRFRVLHFSVQSDHLHLVVEADEPTGLARGLQGLAIRVAKAINRVLGRHGSVWADRYHARSLSTPREVRNALIYVLQNWRKHFPGSRGLDDRSSALWFEGWRSGVRQTWGPVPVAVARTWLARVGWRRGGLIDVEEVPRTTTPARGRQTRAGYVI
jgi:putative transposase